MKVEIEFNVDNAAFDPSKQKGIVHTLNALVDRIGKAEDAGIMAKEMAVMDENDNKIGTYKLMTSRKGNA